MGLTGNLIIAHDTVIEAARTGGGNDELVGNAADNALSAGAGNDEVKDGLGNDTLNGEGGNDDIRDVAGINTLDGGSGRDFVTGGIFSDTLEGGTGNDILRGDPAVEGLGGPDTLTGGTGNDYLMGGRGSDVFVFAPGDGLDTISHVDDDDVIELISGFLFAGSTSPDFEVGVDRIRLDGFSGIDSANVESFVSYTSAGAVFSAQGTTINLLGVANDALTSDHFEFV